MLPGHMTSWCRFARDLMRADAITVSGACANSRWQCVRSGKSAKSVTPHWPGLVLALLFIGPLGRHCSILAADTHDDSRMLQEGRALAAELRALTPEENGSFRATLRLRAADGRRTAVPVEVITTLTETNWQTVYLAWPHGTNGACQQLRILHTTNGPNQYVLINPPAAVGNDSVVLDLAANKAMVPFAGSDYWLVDFGLDFFSWRDQRLVKKEMRKGRSCKVLESLNPEPVPGVYARVVSWIDAETGYLIKATAYDLRNKVIKEFTIGPVRKVNGKWLLKEMTIMDGQKDTRTTLEFDLSSPGKQRN